MTYSAQKKVLQQSRGHVKGHGFKPQKNVSHSKQYRKLHKRTRNHTPPQVNEVSSKEDPTTKVEPTPKGECMSNVQPQTIPHADSWAKRLYYISHC